MTEKAQIDQKSDTESDDEQIKSKASFFYEDGLKEMLEEHFADDLLKAQDAKTILKQHVVQLK